MRSRTVQLFETGCLNQHGNNYKALNMTVKLVLADSWLEVKKKRLPTSEIWNRQLVYFFLRPHIIYLSAALSRTLRKARIKNKTDKVWSWNSGVKNYKCIQTSSSVLCVVLGKWVMFMWIQTPAQLSSHLVEFRWNKYCSSISNPHTETGERLSLGEMSHLHVIFMSVKSISRSKHKHRLHRDLLRDDSPLRFFRSNQQVYTSHTDAQNSHKGFHTCTIPVITFISSILF